MKPSDRFTELTNQTGLFNIQAIDNIPSIMNKGLLSNEKAKNIRHVSMALDEVQAKRGFVKIPNGLRLHQYVNLYFDPWNPMLSRIRAHNEEICILKIDKSILDIKNVVVSDRNASSDYAAFYTPDIGLDKIDFGLVYARSWLDEDYYQQFIKKSIKCAEVLVPYMLSYDYVICAAVINEYAKEKLKNLGFDKEIIIEPRVFF